VPPHEAIGVRAAFFLFFPPTIWAPGGVSVRVDRSRAALERLGVEVTLFNPWERRRDFDVLHIFGSNHEVAGVVESARGLGIPTVVSAIFDAVSPWKGWMATRAARLLPLTTVLGLRRRLLHAADVVIATSTAEAAGLRARFGLDGRKVQVIASGVDAERFRDARADAFVERHGLERFVLRVGRVNRNKGQSRLIRALDGLGLDLVVIGPEDPTDPRGVQEFRALARERPWVHYLGPLSHHDPLLASAYKAARVHAVPSSFESLGFVTLEAAAAGCAVVTGPYAPIREYLGPRAVYCDPASETSIRTAVRRAYDRGPDPGLADFVREHFSWDTVARELRTVYAVLLESARQGRTAYARSRGARQPRASVPRAPADS
jgi:glycosyltransferase involved in cell wall biosynthesis